MSHTLLAFLWRQLNIKSHENKLPYFIVILNTNHYCVSCACLLKLWYIDVDTSWSTAYIYSPSIIFTTIWSYIYFVTIEYASIFLSLIDEWSLIFYYDSLWHNKSRVPSTKYWPELGHPIGSNVKLCHAWLGTLLPSTQFNIGSNGMT